MPDSRILQVLRQQAWERAKGELKSMLTTFYSEGAHLSREDDEKTQISLLNNAIAKFIKDVEDYGLHE